MEQNNITQNTELGQEQMSELGQERIADIGQDQMTEPGQERLPENSRDQIYEDSTPRITERRRVRKAPFIVIACILAALLAVVAAVGLLVVRPVCASVDSISREIGQFHGLETALAIEPYMVPLDAVEGLLEGHESGLNSHEITVENASAVESLGSGVLEVMAADVTIHDKQVMGENLKTGALYAALYMFRGKVIFTVDLNEVRLQHKKDEVIVTIPEPACRLTIDERNTEPVAIYQSAIGSVLTSPKDGITATLNSRADIYEQSAQQIEEYPELIAAAREEAASHVRTLAEAVIIDKKVTVIVAANETSGANDVLAANEMTEGN